MEVQMIKFRFSPPLKSKDEFPIELH